MHNIYEDSDGNASVFVTGKPAWHKLGMVLENPATAEEALKFAGLDFEVEKELIMTESGIQIPDNFATIRKDTKVPLGVVGSKYTIVDNKDAFSFFDSVVDRSEAIYHSAGVLGKGEKIWIMAKMPEYIKVGEEDIEVFVTLMNTHDGSGSVKAFTHVNAIVCENTLNAALGSARSSVSIRHTSGAKDKLGEAHKLLGITNKLALELEEVFNLMSKQKVTKSQTKKFVQNLFPLPEDYKELRANGEIKRAMANEKYRGEVLEAIEVGAGQDLDTRKGTAFGLWNGVTYWLDHQKSYRNDSSKLESIWTGNSASIRQAAFELARSIN